jgi:hypothetical protein
MIDPVIKAQVQHMLAYQAEVARQASAPDDVRRVDRFGIPEYAPLTESDEDRRKRIVAVECLVREVVDLATLHLGRDEARKLFKRGDPADPKGKQAVHEVEILNCYDALFKQHGPSRKLVGHVADVLRRNDQGRDLKSKHFPGDRANTIKTVRRATQARADRLEAGRRRDEEFLAAYKELTGHHLSPSLLEGATNPEKESDV